MITVRLLKFAGPKRHSVVGIFDETAAAEVLVYPEAGQLIMVSGLHGYGTKLYPRSLDELASDVLSALEENGYGETTETIEGETFNDIEEAISYIQDVVLAELEEISKGFVAELDSSIADAKQELEELKDKRKKPSYSSISLVGRFNETGKQE